MHSSYQLDIVSELYNQAFVTYRKAVKIAVKRTLKTFDHDEKEKEEMLKEDLERKLTMCLPKTSAETRKLLWTLYFVVNRWLKGRRVEGLSPTAYKGSLKLARH